MTITTRSAKVCTLSHAELDGNIYHTNAGEWHELEAIEDGTVFENISPFNS